MASLTHWRSAWQALGASDPDEDLFHRLVACYSEPHRKYHTMQHLNECLGHFDKVRSIAERPGEVELALWFHDAIYSTSSTDNEEQSAEWARDSALSGGLSHDQAERVSSLVMITKHNAIPIGRDAEILVDVDLAILGADPVRFDEYERQIREEYSWVPGPLYRRERRRIMGEFASRQTIYRTQYFRVSHEVQARENIARSLAR